MTAPPRPLRLLKEAGIVPRKGLGQHFLTDGAAVEKIVAAVSPEETDLVVEVGPGPGIITFPLAALAGRVVALEKDPRMVALLEERLIPRYGENVEVVEADALQFDYRGLCEAWGKRCKLAGNIPYNISGRLLFDLAGMDDIFSLAVLMLQREVAARITSPPGKKAYGTLSVIVGYFYSVRKVLDLPPGCFRPSPEVHSRVLSFTPRESPLPGLEDRGLFTGLVKSAFEHRRKTLKNSLVSGGHPLFSGPRLDEALDLAGVDPRLRPEALAPEAFAGLANAFYRLSKEN